MKEFSIMSESVPQLDVAFYRKFYPDIATLSVDEAAKHWANFGSKEGRSGNWDDYLKVNPKIASKIPSGFSATIYRHLNPDLREAFSEDWEYVRHYVEVGVGEAREYKVEDIAFLTELFAGEDPGAESDRKLYVNLSHMLFENGVTADGFISELKIEDYITLNPGERLGNLMQCVRHFVERGRAALCPISADHWFEPEFYAEHVPAAPAAPADAYLHWINVGFPAKVRPNSALFCASLGLRKLGRGMPEGFNPALYEALNPDLVLTSRWDALRHVITDGIVERRDGRPEVEDAPDIYLAAAASLIARNRSADAVDLYQAVLSANPDNGWAIQHCADCLLRLGSHYGAAQHYRHAISLGKGDIWTYLNLAQCYAAMGRIGRSADTLAGLASSHPGDVVLRRRAQTAAAERFHQKSAQSMRLGSLGFLEDAQRVMAEAALALVGPAKGLQPAALCASVPVRRVAIVGDTVLAQCRFYRIEQKEEHLAAAGIAVTRYDSREDLSGLVGTLPYVDAVIFYRVPATPDIVEAISAVRAAGIPTFYEVDDLIFDSAHYPDRFESYGGQVDRATYAGLVTGTPLFRAAMGVCDYALASTPALAREMAKVVISGRSFVHRNGLGAPHLGWLEGHERALDGETVTIFYGTGTKAHNEDFDDIVAPSLARLLTKYGRRLRLVIVGYLTVPACLRPFAGQISLSPPVWDLRVYWNALSRMDINLAVLKPGLVSDCKSEIKWLEAAVMGVPSVVSRTATYEDVIDDHIDGVLADTPDDWYNALDLLIGDRHRSEEIGRQARNKAVAMYGVPGAARNLLEIFRAIEDPMVSRKPRLSILIVNVFFPPQAVGGATRVVMDNIRDLVAMYGDELDISVFTTCEGGEVPYALQTYRWQGLKVTSVTASSSPDVDRDPNDDRMAQVFGTFLDDLKPALVHFHCIQRLTGAVCRATRERAIPYLVTVHDGWWISPSQFLLDSALALTLYDQRSPAAQLAKGGPESLYRMQELALQLRGAEQVLAVSESFAALYRSCGFTNVTVVENGVTPFPVAPRRRSPNGRVRLGHIGGMVPHKGFNLLKLVVMSSQYRHLELLAMDHAMLPGSQTETVWGTTPVRIRGKVPQAGIAELYAELDVLVAPSIWPESYGLVVREALRAGCWVIASDRGAIGQDVTPESGFVVDVGSTAALRAALDTIDAAPERYLGPIERQPVIRDSAEQAKELRAIYVKFARTPRKAGRDSRVRQVGRSPEAAVAK